MPSPRRQRGVATLVVTTLLCFAMILVVGYTNRNLVVEQRASANQYRATQAFEAAEAGVEWSLARLNDATRIGADCLPSTDVGAVSFRDRYLRFTGVAGDITSATWDDAGAAVPLRAACVRGDAGWSCSCPATGAPVLSAPDGSATATAFSVEFAAGPRPGVVRAIATGCTRADSVCTAAIDSGHDAASRVEVAFALVPGLHSAPAAALTVRGDIDAGTAALGAHNRDAALGGLALHAGGRVTASALRLTAPAGSPLGGAIASGDTALAGLDGERFFARFFGMDKATWMAQPAVVRVACASDCASVIAAAIAAGSRLIAIDGDLSLDGPTIFATPADPVVLVAAGEVRLSGAVTLHGIVDGASLAWNDAAAPGALVRGAALADGNYTGNGAADFAHDSAVLGRLKTRTGSFARINGSWKDF
ncbi:MAG: PilX N-terminal domain-containing pilus assembly protein [Caldimonas sp.]